MSEAQTKRETWVALLPDGADEPDLVTRGQLLDRLGELELDISERTLMYWESIGILPRADRRYIHGRTQAVYPAGWEGAIHRVIQLQKHGYSLEAIGAHIRETPFVDLLRVDWIAILKAEVFAKLAALAAAVADREGKPTPWIVARIEDIERNVIEDLSSFEIAATRPRKPIHS